MTLVDGKPVAAAQQIQVVAPGKDKVPAVGEQGAAGPDGHRRRGGR